MTRVDWSRDRSRRLVRERGTSDDDDAAELRRLLYSPFGLHKAPSKAQLRREAAALISTNDPVKLLIRCPCGRSATVKVPAGREKIKLRCAGCCDRSLVT